MSAKEFITNKLAGLLVPIFFFLLPFISTGRLFYGTTNLKVIYLFCGSSILLILFALKLWKKQISLTNYKSALTFSAIALLVSYYLSSIFGIFPTGSFNADIIRGTDLFFFSFILLFALLISISLNRSVWKHTLIAIASSTAIVSLLSFIPTDDTHSVKILASQYFTRGVTFGNGTFAATYMLLAIILTVLAITYFPPKSKWRKILSGLILIQIISPLFINVDIWSAKLSLSQIVSNPFAIMGEARAASITLFLSLVYILGLYFIKRFSKAKVSKKLLFSWATIAVAGASILLILLFTPQSFVQNKYTQLSSEARLIVWNEGVQAGLERPILGWGVENFRFANERHFDNQLYYDKNLGEIWFDRAHNVFIDSFVTIGFLGMFIWGILISLLFLTFYRAYKAKLLTKIQLHLLNLLIVAHIVQLQTSFNTPSSYTLLALIFAYAIYLHASLPKTEKAERKESLHFRGAWPRKTVSVLLILFALLSIYAFGLARYQKQRLLTRIFQSKQNEEQLALMEKAFSDINSFEPLRLTAASFLKGWYEQLVNAPEKWQPEILDYGRQQLALYDKYYQQYLSRAPQDYRARMNYVYILLNRSTIGGYDRFDKAKEIIDQSHTLSETNPLTDIMDALNYFYQGDLANAENALAKAYAINPKIKFTQDVIIYFEKEKLNFPEITILKMANL